MQNRDKCARSILWTHARCVCRGDTSDICQKKSSLESMLWHTQAKTEAQSKMASLHLWHVTYKPSSRIGKP